MDNYEPGRYVAVVDDQGFAVAMSGTEYFFLTVRPVLRVYDDYTEPCTDLGPRDVKLYLTDATVDFQIAALRNLGWAGTDFEELYTRAHSFIGLEIQVSCEQREYKGKYYDQFSLYTASSKKASNATIAKLNSKWGDKLKETVQDARVITPEEAKSVADRATQDHIPF